MDGYRNTVFLTIAGEQAAAKARRTGEAMFKRMARMLGEQGLPHFSETRIEIIGAEDTYGAARTPDLARGRAEDGRQAPSKEALELFAREFAAAGTSMSLGTTGAGRRAADADAGDPPVLVPGAQGRGAGAACRWATAQHAGGPCR